MSFSTPGSFGGDFLVTGELKLWHDAVLVIVVKGVVLVALLFIVVGLVCVAVFVAFVVSGFVIVLLFLFFIIAVAVVVVVLILFGFQDTTCEDKHILLVE